MRAAAEFLLDLPYAMLPCLVLLALPAAYLH